jgi:UDP-2,3-diacylglucosamine pyrophosphatase LpxH
MKAFLKSMSMCENINRRMCIIEVAKWSIADDFKVDHVRILFLGHGHFNNAQIIKININMSIRFKYLDFRNYYIIFSN